MLLPFLLFIEQLTQFFKFFLCKINFVPANFDIFGLNWQQRLRNIAKYVFDGKPISTNNLLLSRQVQRLIFSSFIRITYHQIPQFWINFGCDVNHSLFNGFSLAHCQFIAPISYIHIGNTFQIVFYILQYFIGEKDLVLFEDISLSQTLNHFFMTNWTTNIFNQQLEIRFMSVSFTYIVGYSYLFSLVYESS